MNAIDFLNLIIVVFDVEGESEPVRAAVKVQAALSNLLPALYPKADIAIQQPGATISFFEDLPEPHGCFVNAYIKYEGSTPPTSDQSSWQSLITSLNNFGITCVSHIELGCPQQQGFFPAG